jgi:hypothetical protein
VRLDVFGHGKQEAINLAAALNAKIEDSRITQLFGSHADAADPIASPGGALELKPGVKRSGTPGYDMKA